MAGSQDATATPPPPSSSNFVVGDPLGTFSMVLQAQ
jgi:hypothetical protein